MGGHYVLETREDGCAVKDDLKRIGDGDVG